MRTYTIKQGNHYANGLNFKLHNNLHQLNFKAKLSSNCLYQFPDITGEHDADNFDINKVHGVTWGLFNDNDSFRTGWNCGANNGLHQWYAYIHERGIMKYQFLFEEEPNVEVNFNNWFLRSNNLIGIERLDKSGSYEVPFNFEGVSEMGYYNFPYFGGNKVAPHLMNIGIE